MNVARVLPSFNVVALDEVLGKRAGMLLSRSGTGDVIDAAVVAIARDGDDNLISDPGDLRKLAGEAGVHVELVPI